MPKKTPLQSRKNPLIWKKQTQNVCIFLASLVVSTDTLNPSILHPSVRCISTRYWVKQNEIWKTPLHGFFYLSLMFLRRQRESLHWLDISMILFVGQYLCLEKIVHLSEAPEHSSLKSIYGIFLVRSSQIFRMQSTKNKPNRGMKMTDMIQSICHIRAPAPRVVKTCFRRKVQGPLLSRQRGLIVTWFGVIVNVGGQALCYRQYAHCKSTRNATLLLLYYKLQRHAGQNGRLTPSQKECKYRGSHVT